MNYFFPQPNLIIKFSDVVDIIIVSYIIYKFMLWIKETRAWSLFKGIVVILLIFSFSSLFNFSTLYWLISNTINVGLIAIIIIFQPELRKALEQLGKGKLISFSKLDEGHVDVSEESIDEIIKAVKLMAKSRTGALIVLEKEVPLGDFESTGVKLDSVISHQLLLNIFEDKTPLHDGAVIIRNNRLKAAACILPLTQSGTKYDFGTRHRAAIGASETSDANVIVVSEERGEISIAKNGKLNRNLDEKQIRSMLTDKPKTKRILSLWKGQR